MHHGKEIYLFFSMYGINGIIGIIISQTLIGIIIYKVLVITKQRDINNHLELIENINKNKRLNEIMKIIINTFLLITFYIMVAGFGAYFNEQLGVPNLVGVTIIITLCYAILMKNIEGITKLNMVLIPMLIIYIITLMTKNLEAFEHINNKMIETSFFKSIYKAIIYSSYNSITLIPIVVSLKKYSRNKKDIIKISIICTVLLTILAFAIYGLIIKVDIDINKLELPTVYVAGMSGVIHKYIYGIIILMAIFTSAISTAYSLLEKYEKEPRKYKFMLIILCVSAIAVSKMGFSNLINKLYPIFGLLGLIQIILLLHYKT